MRFSGDGVFIALLLLLVPGCGTTAERGCFVGLNLIPPSPILICGLDISKTEAPDVREAP